MKNKLVVTLYGKVPSKKNSKRRIKRGNNIFMVPSKAHEVWHREQMIRLRNRPIGWKPEDRIHKASVSLTFYAGDMHAGDLSNKTESVMDLFVDAGLLIDDNWFVVGDSHQIFGGVDEEIPRVIATLMFNQEDLHAAKPKK